MDFGMQIKVFTEQLVELIEQAKQEASLEFVSDKLNWEQTAREYEAEIAGLENTIETLSHRLEDAEQKYLTLQTKISALV